LESNEIVTLKQELDFIRGYTYLLKTRFNDKLHINIEVEDSDDHYLIPMTLQLLVENAVKHNEISEKYPLNVTIRLNGDYIEVENSVKKKKTIEKSNKVGLRNIRQQLGFSTKKELEVIPGDESFLVRVPLIDIVEHYSKYL
jgi:LytS/YehU family sensor histidine kinase